MRVVLVTGFIGTIAFCCGLPEQAKKEEAKPEARKAEAPPVAPPATKGTGAVVAALEADGADCALHAHTIGGADRTLARLRGACPPDAQLVVHPAGSDVMLVDGKGVTTVEVATGIPRRLPELDHLMTARWDSTGNVVALTTEAAPDPKDGAVTVDGERMSVAQPDAVAIEVGRVFSSDGQGWKKQKAFLAYGYEGMSTEQMFAEELGRWVGVAPGADGGAQGDLGQELTENTPGPGAWRRDGSVAFQFEWLEGVIPHGPIALMLPTGTWKTLPGFETAQSLAWAERTDVLWVSGGKRAVFDLKTGETLWQTEGPAWLLPADVHLAEATAAAPPPPPGAGGERPRREMGERPGRPEGAGEREREHEGRPHHGPKRPRRE